MHDHLDAEGAHSTPRDMVVIATILALRTPEHGPGMLVHDVDSDRDPQQGGRLVR